MNMLLTCHWTVSGQTVFSQISPVPLSCTPKKCIPVPSLWFWPLTSQTPHEVSESPPLSHPQTFWPRPAHRHKSPGTPRQWPVPPLWRYVSSQGFVSVGRWSFRWFKLIFSHPSLGLSWWLCQCLSRYRILTEVVYCIQCTVWDGRVLVAKLISINTYPKREAPFNAKPLVAYRAVLNSTKA